MTYERMPRRAAIAAAATLALTLGLGIAPAAVAAPEGGTATQTQAAPQSATTWPWEYQGRAIPLSYSPGYDDWRPSMTVTYAAGGDIPDGMTVVGSDGTRVEVLRNSSSIQPGESDTFGVGILDYACQNYVASATDSHPGFRLTLTYEKTSVPYGQEITVTGPVATSLQRTFVDGEGTRYAADVTVDGSQLPGTVTLSNGDTAPVAWGDEAEGTTMIDGTEHRAILRHGTARGAVTVRLGSPQIGATGSVTQHWFVNLTAVVQDLGAVAPDVPQPEVTWAVEFMGKQYEFLDAGSSTGELWATLPERVTGDLPDTLVATSSDGRTAVLEQVQWTGKTEKDGTLGQVHVSTALTRYATKDTDPKLSTTLVGTATDLTCGEPVTVDNEARTPFTYDADSGMFTASIDLADANGASDSRRIVLSDGQETPIVWGDPVVSDVDGRQVTKRTGVATGVVRTKVDRPFGDNGWFVDQSWQVTVTDVQDLQPGAPQEPGAVVAPAAPDDETSASADVSRNPTQGTAATVPAPARLATTGSALAAAAVAAGALLAAGVLMLRRRV